MEDNFFTGVGGWGGIGVIQLHYIDCALYFYYYYISPTSDHQASDPRVGGPCSVGFPGGSEGKESACKAGDLDSILGVGRSPGEGNGNPLQ